MAKTVQIVISAENQAHLEHLDQFDSFRLADLTYESDAYISPREFFYLVDLKKGDSVCPEQIKTAVAYLFKKQKFQTIELALSDGDAGKQLHFKLTSFWTFAKLTIRGVPVGRYRYRQCYLMEPGDTFYEDKHVRSIERIKQNLKDEGYFQSNVFSRIDRDEETKTVRVDITINRGRKFFVGFVHVDFKDRKNSNQTERSGLLGQLGDALAKRLHSHSYSKETINKELEAFKHTLARRGFLHVTIRLTETIDRTRRKVDLNFVVDVLEKRTFVFFGNNFFSNAQLLDQILEFGPSAWLVPASILAQEMEREYKKKGFWSVSIDVQEEQARIFFVIKEGVRTSIKTIAINGVHALEERELKKQCFRPLLRKKQFDQALLDRCVERLATFYNKHGFWDMRVLKQSFVSVEGSGAQRLELVIDEGRQTFFTSVSISGFEYLVSRFPFSQFAGKKVRVPFDPQIMHEQKTWLQNYFKKRGYDQFKIAHELVRDGNNVQLVWKVRVGPKRIFGKTVLLGSSRFPFDILLTQFDYHAGSLWNKKKLQQTAARLRALDLFERVHLFPDRGLPAEIEDILLKLHKDDPFEIRFRAGAGLQQVGRNFSFDRGAMYKVGGTFLVKNPLNFGDRFIVDVDFARPYRNVHIEYVRACVFGLPLINRFKVYTNRYEQPGFVCSKHDLYGISQEGFLFGLKGRYGPLDVGGTLGVEWMRTSVKKDMQSIADNIARAICFESELLGKKIPYLFFEPVVLLDYLDNNLNPRSGSFTLLTLKGMVPLSDRYTNALFLKLFGKQTFFVPLGPVVAAFQIRFGYIFYQRFKQIMPFERFYLGGAHSVRSYETDLCPPLGSFIDEDGAKSCVPQGGKVMLNGNVELRFPIVSDIGGAIFQDLGVLIGSDCCKFDPANVIAGTGFGLRYNTPIGPLRFDIAWKWRACHPACHAYAWFLSLGHAF